MRELKGLKEIYNNYDTFIIDLWGVMHNGIMLNPSAIEAVENLQKNSKKFVFLSNAPRPSANVISFLLKMKMDKKYLSNVMTSGEAAMYAINQKKFGKNTKEALNAGFVWGYEGLINNIINKIILKNKKNFKVILTGGYANFFKKIIKKNATVDQNITINGIANVYKELI